MGELIEISWPSHRENLCERIWNLFDTKVGWDFLILFNNKTSLDNHRPLGAHFLIMQMFCQTLANSNLRQFQFEEETINSSDLNCLLEFMYRGRTQVKLERLEDVKKAAEKLGLDSFIGIVQEKVKDKLLNIEVENNCAIKEVNSDEEITPENEPEIVDLCFDSDCNEEIVTLSENAQNLNEDNFKNIIINDITSGISQGPSVETENNLCSDSKFICDLCGRKFKKKWKCDRHVSTHSDPNGLPKCPYCPRRTKYLRLHLANTHQRDWEGNFLEKSHKCDECNYKCAAAFLLSKHKLWKHGEKKHKCEQCPYASTTKYILKTHVMNVHATKSLACEICGSLFKGKRNLVKHKLIHLYPQFKCDICDKIMSGKRKLERHLNQHKTFECAICKRGFQIRHKFKYHLQNTHNLSDDEITKSINIADVFSKVGVQSNSDPSGFIQCPYCNFKGKTIEAHVMEVHQKDLDGNLIEKYKCDECDFTSSINSLMLYHKTMNHAEKMPHDDRNSDSSQIKENLDKHAEAIRQSGEGFTCEKRGLDFSRPNKNSLPSQMKNYLAQKKTSVSVNEMNCNKCEFKCRSFSELESHYKIKHNMGEKDDSAILTNINLNETPMGEAKDTSARLTDEQSIAERNTESKYDESRITSSDLTSGLSFCLGRETESISYSGSKLICDQCGKRFKMKWKLDRHVSTHSDPSGLPKCPYCPRRTKYLRFHLANSHQRDWEGNFLEKSHKCDECDYTCAAAFLITRHKLWKHGEKKHKCGQCPYASTTKSLLKIHLENVHSTETFTCETCGSYFKSKRNLVRHKTLHLYPLPKFPNKIKIGKKSKKALINCQSPQNRLSEVKITKLISITDATMWHQNK